jgi:hypothetical protein
MVKLLLGPGDILVQLWKVLFDGPKPGPEGDYTLHFVDFAELIKPDDYFTLTPQYIDNLQKLIESEFNYSIMGNIKSVRTPRGEDWTHKHVWALLGLYSIDQWQDVSIGALISERADKDWEVLGFYPPNITRFPAINRDFVVNYVQAYTQRPEKFTGVHVYTPITTKS